MKTTNNKPQITNKSQITISKFRNWKLFVICCLGFVILLFAVSLLQSANSFDRSTSEIVIPQGASTARIQIILEDAGVLREYSSFAFAAKILGLSKHIQAGKYSFSPSETLFRVLWKLRKGRVVLPEQIQVTFPEGTSIYKMGEILKAAGYKDYKKFQALVVEGITKSAREKYWHIFKYIPSESLEGYLYPDTYQFFAKADVYDLVDIMLKRFDQVVMPFWEKAKKDTKLNLHEILTLASIIEKEAKLRSEFPIISSVYHNRLELRMYLAACPTIKYALERPTKKVYKDQLEIDSPYNTYKRRGLPPGPICNPGIESIKAAIYPADTDYCYFVAKEDGSHIFSRSGLEHQKAKQKVATPTQ